MMQPNDSIPNLSPTERVKAEMDKLLGYAPEEKEEKVLPPHGIYKDELGREHNMDDIQARGVFHIKPEIRDVVSVVLIIMLPIAALIVLAMVYLRGFFLLTGLNVGLIITVEAVIYCILGFFVFYQCITKKHGRPHNYKADGRAFYVETIGFDKLGNKAVTDKTQILFKDVLSVDYTPTRLFWGNRGYKVDIVTIYGTIHYDYIFPRFRHAIIPEYLPFDVIKKNIAPREDKTQEAKDKN